MRGIISDLAPTFILVAALFGSYVTRRNAKDTSALGGFTALATELRQELSDAKTEAKEARTEARRTQERVQALEDEEHRKAVLARVHQRWDEMIGRELRKCNPESSIPDPPPLD